MSSRLAILIAGPTASGKSGLAIELAKNHNGVVINTDSMQVYSILQEITARPDEVEMDGVEHLLFGHVAPGAPYSVAIWMEQAANAIDTVRSAGKLPILVGGTGLYFKAILEGLSQVPTVDPDIRRKLRDASLIDVAPLYDELNVLDPDGAAKLEPGDTQRIVRALEVVKSTGKSLFDWQSAPKSKSVLDGAHCEKIVILPPRELLNERIARRFHAMVEKGALAEVEALMELGLDHEMPAMRAIGVSQLASTLKGERELDEMIELSIIATRQYAKRQRTWFRHQFDASWRVLESADEYSAC
ncbi:MAG: tRNA (adenosine(37)-N6)-dimethylallyltransferase MiaA [Salaquimonas sp.]